ncbi:MAG TPA: hypothetical protein VE077_06060 [Candidatus Methylomirabilis sp.]|nr:hypothetical protein [Candidatus Methylomirabilis sp.]
MMIDPWFSLTTKAESAPPLEDGKAYSPIHGFQAWGMSGGFGPDAKGET